MAAAYPYLYVSSISAPYFLVYDISNPCSLTLVGSCAVPYHAGYDISVNGDYACIAASSAGLLIIDISNPASPQLISQMALGDYPMGVHSVGQIAYVSMYASEIKAIDISNPANPVEVGFHDTPSNAHDVYYASPYIYVTCDTAGLLIYEYLGTGFSERTNADANPAYQLLHNPILNGYVELKMMSNQASSACDLSIYDPAGRRIFDRDGRASAIHEGYVRLPVKDLAEGVYFLAVRKDGLMVQQFKIVKVR